MFENRMVRRKKWTGNLAHNGEIRNVNKILFGRACRAQIIHKTHACGRKILKLILNKYGRKM
jgi:hypothetical protein